MFNKIFRRGKTTKDDAPPLPPSYKNSFTSPSEYEYGSKNYNLNNKSPYTSSTPNKYAAKNDSTPPWSTFDSTKYDHSPVNKTQNVYTAPPQRHLPYNQQNSNIANDKSYDKPFQKFTVGSPNLNPYSSSYKPNNTDYSTRTDKSESSSQRYDSSPYITLGSTYSQNRPSYESFKKDGSVNRSQPGTPTATRREVHDPNSYANRNVYQTTPNRTFESPQRESHRSTFSPHNNINSNSRFSTKSYESPHRENITNRNNAGSYNHIPSYTPDTSSRNFTSPFSHPANSSIPEVPKYDHPPKSLNSNYTNFSKNNYNDSKSPIYKPSFNVSNINNAINNPPSPEPGKYVPYAVRKALKESQQANKEEPKNVYNNSNLNNNNKLPSKYTYTPYKPAYETQDTSSNRVKSPYGNVESTSYFDSSRFGNRNAESSAGRLISPPATAYNRIYGQNTYNEPPELPPRTPNLRNNPTTPNYGYYNTNTNENKTPYTPYSNELPYSPSFASPTPSHNDYINLSATPKPFSSSQFNTETTNKNQNSYDNKNSTNTTTEHANGKHYNQNIEPTKNLYTINNTVPNSYNDTTKSNYNNPSTNYKTTHTPSGIFSNENKFSENNTSYAPQNNPYDTHQSYVQMPQYNYRSGEHTTATTTNTNAFDDWLPKNASNLNENSLHSSTRNESELWKREKHNANDNQNSKKAFGTVPYNLNTNDYLNDKNNIKHRNLNTDSSFKQNENFDRDSLSSPSTQQQPEQNIELSSNYTISEKPLSSISSNSSFSVASPLLQAASITAAAANISYEPKGNASDEEKSDSDPKSSSEQINIKSSSPKKTVRFFNPIDKSRDFINDIMAKGKNRGHNKHKNNNNNNNNKNSNQKSNSKNNVTKTPLIISNETNSDLKDMEKLNSNNESEILNSFENNMKNNNIKSEINLDEEDCNKSGYQISKSKNSRDIVNKLQNPRAKLASPEDDENDNIVCINGKNYKNKYDDDNTDNTDTETLDENFEDDDETTRISNNNAHDNNTKAESSKKLTSTSQKENENSKSACDNKFNNTKSFSEDFLNKNFQQQPHIQQVYHQQSHEQNSNLPSVNENYFDRDSRSSVRVGKSTQPSFSREDKTGSDYFSNNNKHKKNNKNKQKYENDEQIEKIEKLSELTECDRDNFIETHNSMGQSQTKAPTTSTAPESPRLGRSRSSSPPNRTINKPPQLSSSDYAEIYNCSLQRDREPVIEEPLSPTTPLSPTESCDQFYDITNDTTNSNNSTIPLPKVTVADYSENTHTSNIEPDIFYDFETITTNSNSNKNLSKSPPKYPPPPPSPSAQFKSRSTSPIDIVTLEDIEEEEDEDDWHFVNNNSSNENSKNDTRTKQQQQPQSSPSTNQNYLNSPTFNRRNFSTPSSQQQSSPILARKSPTPQRSTFDYDDYRDGLNTPDSGIGGATTPIPSINNSTITTTTTASSSSSNSSKVLVINSCDLVNDTDDIELLHSHQKHITNNYYNNNTSSTINLCENNNSYIESNSEYSSINNTTSIVIDSISLPDVVIETKPKDNENRTGTTLSAQNDDYILNVSKSKSEGNVHFIPIHVEGREKPKIEIVEETTEYQSSNTNNINNSITNDFETNSSNSNNGFIEDISNQDISDHYTNNNDIDNHITVIKAEETVKNNHNNESSCNSNTNVLNSTSTDDPDDSEDCNYCNSYDKIKKLEKELEEKLKKTKEEKLRKEEELKRELVTQEARFNAQLQEAQRNASSAQERAHELQMKIDQLEQDISLKSWHIERLNGEIQAIQIEHTAVRKRLQTIESEKDRLRQEHLDNQDEYETKYENLEEKYKELEEKYNKLRHLATTLQTQLANAKAQADDLQSEKEQLCEEKDAELNRLQELLDKAIEERKELEIKWNKEFELLRNHNQEHEEQLLTDCEFQLRSMQKKCKEKIEAAERAKEEVLERNAELEEKVAEGEGYNERLKNLQAEVRQLRGLTNEQRESITHMHKQIESLKIDLEAANIDLEQKIEEVRKIKLCCDNTLLFKDREMIQKIDDATREVATIWEEKLLTEMTRLTNELEAVHSEERLSDMNKLQNEHIEELKVLTNRYTNNEEELRKELEEVSEKLQYKTEQYLELRDKTDNEILTTRIHLDKADRDYQQAMNRELDKKQELEDKLRKEFDEEKAEMEALYEQRIRDVKDNFKKEMANQTHEIAQRHRKQLEQQWDQLVAEKEDALQTLEKRHKIKLEDQENRLKELLSEQRNLEVQHRRDMKELKEAYDIDRSSLQNRDIHNSQEIEQLHRKCRCLTNLFEEMRLRYERREPRPEDLREIDELRARCDSQERDLCELTERLREMQIQMEEIQAASDTQHQNRSPRKKPIRKPPPKQIPISCDVIYEEENEETDSIGEDISVKTNENDNSESESSILQSDNQIVKDESNGASKETDDEEEEVEEDE